MNPTGIVTLEQLRQIYNAAFLAGYAVGLTAPNLTPAQIDTEANRVFDAIRDHWAGGTGQPPDPFAGPVSKR